MTQVLRGGIEPLGLVDVLAYLGRSGASGVLNVTRDEVKKSIIVHGGSIIFAKSNQVQDRLGDILLAQGLIDQEQYDEGTALIYEKGYRHGRALIEIGAISPKLLWNTIQEQIRTIACSVIPWDSGSFEFIEREVKHKESITLELPILDVVTDVIRNLDNRALFKTRFPNMNEILLPIPLPMHEPGEEPPTHIELEPYEAYILNFVDGKSSVRTICEQSDYGEAESLRVLYLLKSLGRVDAIEGEEPEAEPEPEAAEAAADAKALPPLDLPPELKQKIHPMVLNFNDVFRYLHHYLEERVGKVGTNLLRKYYDDTRESHPALFAEAELQPDGSLDLLKVQANLDAMGVDETELTMALDEGMSEFLNLCILAVKKVLGTEHESIVVQHIGSLF